MALEMEQAMNKVANDLFLPGGPIAPGLPHRFVHADKHLPVQSGAKVIRITERDDISAACVAEKPFVQAGHLTIPNEQDSHSILFTAASLQYGRGDVLQELHIDFSAALPIPNVKLTHLVYCPDALRTRR